MDINFKTAVKLHFDSLSKKEKEISNYILTNIEDLKSSSIQEIAEATNSSNSSISRFVRKLGFENFQQMIISFHMEDKLRKDNNVLPAKISPDDSPKQISNSVFQTGINSLLSTQSILNEDALLKAVEILEKSNVCAFFGMGGSSVIALNALHRFLKSSLHCTYAQDFHMQLIEASKLGENDSALIITHTGRNKDILRIIEILKSNNVKVIVITSNASSPAASMSDCTLLSISEETNYQPEAMSSMVAQLLLVDALFVIYSVKIDKDLTYFSYARSIINNTRI